VLQQREQAKIRSADRQLAALAEFNNAVAAGEGVLAEERRLIEMLDDLREHATLLSVDDQHWDDALKDIAVRDGHGMDQRYKVSVDLAAVRARLRSAHLALKVTTRLSRSG